MTLPDTAPTAGAWRARSRYERPRNTLRSPRPAQGARPSGPGRCGIRCEGGFVNAAEWKVAARPVVDDLAAVLAEHGGEGLSPADLGRELYGYWRAAADRPSVPRAGR